MNRDLLRRVIDETLIAVPQLIPLLSVKSQIRTRDPHEPGREDKLKFDRKLELLMRRHFAKQSDFVQQKLEWHFMDRALKATVKPPTDWINDPGLWDDPEFQADLMILIKDAAIAGIDLFGKAVTIGMDYTLVNSKAAQWASQYTFDLVKDINDTTMTALQQAISTFANTPGMTIGDAMDMMPFGAVRAQMVATTEITRAYATANEISGKQMKKEYPDIPITKTWATNNDDRVCDICEPLDGMTVEIDDGFTTDEDKSEGIPEPPAHVNCRCWTIVGPNILWKGYNV